MLCEQFVCRYPGNPRAINAGAFDAYLLKSLDGGCSYAKLFDWDRFRFKPIKMSLHRCSYTTRDPDNPSVEDEGRIEQEKKDGANQLWELLTVWNRAERPSSVYIYTL